MIFAVPSLRGVTVHSFPLGLMEITSPPSMTAQVRVGLAISSSRPVDREVRYTFAEIVRVPPPTGKVKDAGSSATFRLVLKLDLAMVTVHSILMLGSAL